jgi:hypothetical protein
MGAEMGTGGIMRHYIAVGTVITGRPPHRSVREELPHTAPPSGQTIAAPMRFYQS